MRLRSVQPARPSAGGDASCFLAQPVHTLYSFGSQSVLISCKGRGSCASASFRPFQFCRVEMSISAQPGTQADLPTAGRLVLRWAEYLVFQSNSLNSTVCPDRTSGTRTPCRAARPLAGGEPPQRAASATPTWLRPRPSARVRSGFCLHAPHIRHPARAARPPAVGTPSFAFHQAFALW